jgi:hypothetical protein
MKTDFGGDIADGIASQGNVDDRRRALCRIAPLSSVLIGAALSLCGCGGGGDVPSAGSVEQGAPAAPGAIPPATTLPPTPPAVQTPSEPAVPAPVAMTELSGTWEYVGNNAGETSAYEFREDGTFGFYSRFSGIATVAEAGKYSVEGNKVTVRPEAKLYEGEDTSPGAARTYEWRVEPDSIRGGRLLTLTLDGGIPNKYHGT